MAKLEGFSKVAVVNYGGYSDYHFAIYEDGVDYQVGDTLVCFLWCSISGLLNLDLDPWERF